MIKRKGKVYKEEICANCGEREKHTLE